MVTLSKNLDVAVPNVVAQRVSPRRKRGENGQKIPTCNPKKHHVHKQREVCAALSQPARHRRYRPSLHDRCRLNQRVGSTVLGSHGH
mmetsp:Transcript_77919/g.114037  ORF Transcript_77919/g.114037 Transcript_77919/m.114037 type:complete len:87 (-) Transcript_77919:1662-1922(-)